MSKLPEAKTPEQIKMIEYLLEMGVMNDWEDEFLDSLEVQEYPLTDKQAAVLLRIYESGGSLLASPDEGGGPL